VLVRLTDGVRRRIFGIETRGGAAGARTCVCDDAVRMPAWRRYCAFMKLAVVHGAAVGLPTHARRRGVFDWQQWFRTSSLRTKHLGARRKNVLARAKQVLRKDFGRS